MGGEVAQVVNERDGRGVLLLQPLGDRYSPYRLAVTYTYEGDESPLRGGSYVLFDSVVEGALDYETTGGQRRTVPQLSSSSYWTYHVVRQDGGSPWVTGETETLIQFWLK